MGNCFTEELRMGVSRGGLDWLIHNGKRLFRIVAGALLIGAGLAMLVLPGPGILVIVLGLSLLAIEFEWARRISACSRSTP
jgi:hypothetical protein